MNDLDKLIKAVEGDPAAPVEGVFEFATRDQAQWAAKAYNGDLNAALRLHEALLPGYALERLALWHGCPATVHIWGTHKERDGKFWHDYRDGRFEANADNPARAWLLAILKALSAQATP